MDIGFSDQLLNEKQLAAWLGLSLPSLQRMRSNGSGPHFIRLSERRIGYRKSSVERWLETRTVNRVGIQAAWSKCKCREVSVNTPNAKEAPEFLDPKFERMPSELKQLQNWVLWVRIWTESKWTKRPSRRLDLVRVQETQNTGPLSRT